MLAGALDDTEGAVELAPPGLFVPAVTHLMAIGRVPAAGAEHWRGIDPHAAGAERVEPTLARGGQIAPRGGAALHQVAQRGLGRGHPDLRTGLEQWQGFVPRTLVQLAAADRGGRALKLRLG